MDTQFTLSLLCDGLVTAFSSLHFNSPFFFLIFPYFFKNFVCLFLAVLSLHCRLQASHVVASLAAERGL